ncbi:hypothetical protein IWW55_002065 [Coemansia sp. RSA 2706]|nr:hypothetical protein IWW55_002065 [Coemansia sp. RSA 2706]KAJ2312960.1 hypothetical protein IWW54_001786 [Coemansia sp. RSA 2705]KAJ2327331.1 hypothetical protein IWW51_001813 [Coemansia sp. RSA 2702]
MCQRYLMIVELKPGLQTQCKRVSILVSVSDNELTLKRKISEKLQAIGHQLAKDYVIHVCDEHGNLGKRIEENRPLGALGIRPPCCKNCLAMYSCILSQVAKPVLITPAIQSAIARHPCPRAAASADIGTIIRNQRTLDKALATGKLSIPAAQLVDLAQRYVDANTTAQLEQWQDSVLPSFNLDITAIYHAARLFDLISADKGMAQALHKVAAEHGNADAAFAFGLALMRGQLRAPNGPAEGTRIVRALSDGGHPMSQIVVAEIYLNANAYARRAQGIALLEQAAAKSPVASYKLGEIYRRSDVVARDMDQAREWHVRAAKAGIADSYFHLGTMLASGEGKKGASDLPGALRMYELGAAAGSVESQYNAGMCYLQGRGAAKNVDLAVEFLVLAAAARFPVALLNLGKLFVEGAEVPRDLRRGRNYLEIAKQCGGGADGFIGGEAEKVLEKHRHIKEMQCVIL